MDGGACTFQSDGTFSEIVHRPSSITASVDSRTNVGLAELD